MPQKLFKITQVSFYKRQKEDIEIFVIGLVLIFIQKLTFLFFKQVKERAVWRHTSVGKLNLVFWTSEIFEVSTKTPVSCSLGSSSHGHEPGQFYLGRCGREPTAGFPPN